MLTLAFPLQPVGLITEPTDFGLSQYAIGIRKNMEPSVVEAISYWMTVLMSCSPLDRNGSCPEGNFATMYAGRGGTGKECGYVANPLPPPSEGRILSGFAVACIVLGAVLVTVFACRYWSEYKNQRQRRQITVLEEKVQERTREMQEANDILELTNHKVIRASASQLKHFACMSHEVRFS